MQSILLKLSIIIPVYNEATHIHELLLYIKSNLKTPLETELLVVDGGSTDGTSEIISKEKDIVFIESPKGRGAQMNLGAKLAKGTLLYFLHADSFPPKYFDEAILNEVVKGNEAGCFKMKFRSKHCWLHLASWFTQFNVKYFRGGDQSLFITKKCFDELGGFSETSPIFEDVHFIRKLYSKKSFSVIQQWISTSARRYKKNGVARLQYHYWLLYFKNWMGVSPQKLLEYYKSNIK